MRVMDLQQEQLARSLGDGHRVIHGVAGSGKTLILGFRCVHLAEMLRKPFGISFTHHPVELPEVSIDRSLNVATPLTAGEFLVI